MKSAVFVLLMVAALVGGTLVAQGTGDYAGVDKCRMCHSDIFNDWSKSAHARGFELLMNVGQEKNPECLVCHSTGYNKGGYVDETSTSGLKGTTCEACHGPGAEHAATVDKQKIVRVPAADTCGACHQENNIHSLKS